MSVYRRKRPDGTIASPYWYYEFQFDGVRFRGSTETADRRSAERVARAKLEEVKASAARGAQLARRAMTVEEACSRYWDEVGQHAATSDDIWSYLRLITRLIGKTTALPAISPDMIAKAISRRRADLTGAKDRRHLVSAATVNRTFTEPLRRVLRRARDVWGQPTPTISWRDLLLAEPQERVREASPDEEAKILAAIRGDYRPAIEFLLASACRLEEAVNLTWDKVYWAAGAIEITGKGRRGSADQVGLIPITAAIRAILWPLRHDHASAVFTYRTSRRDPKRGIAKGDILPITYEGLKTRWRRDVSGEVANFRSHDLRHTALTRLVRKTGNLKLAQKLARHKDIATTARYAHASLDDLREAMERAEAPQNHPHSDIATGHVSDAK